MKLHLNLHRSAARWLLLTLLFGALSASSFGQIGIGISVRVGPPALPIYAQPICPGPGYLWTPGYWGWNDDGGYYWVPGTWVVAPVGMLWTPGYWGWGGGFYAWHGGYWGPHIGFYGGINYGYGYGGVGFVGGEWRGGGFYYNRSVTNVSVTNVTNVYNKTVIVNNNTTTSFNGGEGGVRAEPTAQERAAEHEQHVAPLAAQTQHETLAAQNKQNFASENHGRPAIAATAKAGDFSNRSAIPARAAGGEYHAPAMSPKEARGPAAPGNRPFTPASTNNGNRPTGNPAVTPQEKGSANGGFRPFTPPNSTNSPNKGSSGGSSSSPTYHPSGTTGTNHVNEPKGNSTSNPPRNNGNGSGGNNNHNASKPADHHSSPPPQHKPNNPPKGEHDKGKGR
jgi:hypothetical protein